MRVRHVLLCLCISLPAQYATAIEEEELPALELLGFIADFSDEEEGWVDPQELEQLFSLGSGAPNPDSTGRESGKTGLEGSGGGTGNGSSQAVEPYNEMATE